MRDAGFCGSSGGVCSQGGSDCSQGGCLLPGGCLFPRSWVVCCQGDVCYQGVCHYPSLWTDKHHLPATSFEAVINWKNSTTCRFSLIIWISNISAFKTTLNNNASANQGWPKVCMVMGKDTGQECIPVGCLQGGLCDRDPSDRDPVDREPPPATQPVGRQTPVELLPFPKLSLRAVKMYITKS